MQVPAKRSAGGRPGIPAEKRAEAETLLRNGRSPREVMGATGLGQTKVYEILRLVKASAQDSDKPQGAQ